MIVGLFQDIINILSKYGPEDFKIQYLYLYALSGLAKHVDLLPLQNQELQKYILYELICKYKLDNVQSQICCDYMNFSPLKCE